MRIALITNGVVVNVILSDGTLTAQQLHCDSIVQLVQGQVVNIGDSWNGSSFTPGPPDATTNQSTIQGNLAAAMASLRAFSNLASPTNAQTVAAAQLQAKVLLGLIRIINQQLDGTS